MIRAPKKANRVATTTIPREQLAQKWVDFLKLDGMKTSEMTDQQLRLVEFFTARKAVKGKWVRRVDNYIANTLLFLNITKLSSGSEYEIDIIEDKEVFFEPQASTLNIIDVAFHTLDNDVYVPTRSRKDKPFERIVYSSKLGFYIPGDGGKNFRGSEEPFDLLNSIPDKLSLCSEIHLDAIYAEINNKTAKILGNNIVTDDYTVEIDTLPMPTKTSTCYLINLRLIGELAFYSKTEEVPAPEYIRSAIAVYLEERDIDKLTEYLGGMGAKNKGVATVPASTRGISYRTLQVAVDGLYNSLA